MKRENLLKFAISASLLAVLGCNADYGTDATSGATSSQSASGAPASASLSIYDASSGALVYSDAGGPGSVSLVGGKAYKIQVAVSNAGSAPVSKVTVMNSSIPALALHPSVLTMNSSGSGQFTAVAGQYSFQLNVMNGNAQAVAKSYTGSASCPNPNASGFTASSLNASGLAVSLAGSNNLFSYNASSVVSGANGVAPYQCAYDLNGTGIVDTAFTDCGAHDYYSNFLGSRNVNVVVVDSCGVSASVSKSVSFSGNVPAMGAGNVFIAGQVSSDTGTAASDPRIDNVDYLATNQNPSYDIVQPNFAMSGGKGTFQIQSSLNYGQPSSLPFGITINVSGITGTFNLSSNPTGTVVTSGAKVSSIVYSTDQNGDQDPAVSMSSSSCTTGGISAKVTPVVGQPCSSGTSGDNNSATVEVWGTYTCTNVSDSGGSVTISGSFDGLTDMADGCSGGGGGGGGIAPITF